MDKKIPLLSKSRYTSGLQCHKRLYLECFHRDLMEETSAGLQARFDMGHVVGELAQRRFPGGVLLSEDHFEHEAAVRKTAGLMAQASVPALYEAAFLYDGVRVRSDVLVRNGDGWDLIEVKSTTQTKQQHYADLAIQYYVLKGSGVAVKRAYLMHLNNEYVYAGGAYDLERLFTPAELTREVLAMKAAIPALLAGMRAPLLDDRPPVVAVSPHCKKPYECPFLENCGSAAKTTAYPIDELPRLSQAQALRDELVAAGVTDIRDIPDTIELQPEYKRIRDVVKSGVSYVHEGASARLAGLARPLHFVDFEVFSPVLPLFPGTRSFQRLAFQWSNHIQQAGGGMDHKYFLDEGKGDPREAFIASLLASVGTEGTILVYSSYEASVLGEIAADLPQYAEAIAKVIARIFDLLPFIKEHVYHPAFHGSYSIKKVLPALVPQLGYGDLAIAEGEAAAHAFEELTGLITEERRQEIRRQLLDYCGRDTEAMVALVGVLGARGAGMVL